MSQFFTILVSALALSASAAPITQVASTAKWEAACSAAGGGQACNRLTAALFAAHGPCEQQDAAHEMIDLAKTLRNNGEVLRLAQVFVPFEDNCSSIAVASSSRAVKRNVAPSSTTETAPAAAETSAEECNEDEEPTDDEESADDGSDDDEPTADSSDDSSDDADCTEEPEPSTVASVSPSAITTPAASFASSPSTSTSPSASASPSSASNFKHQNGLDAQSLNTKFASLSNTSTCTEGEEACLNGTDFAQCVGGKFVTSKCNTNLVCAALPLINKAGISITCTTKPDVDARIAAALSS